MQWEGREQSSNVDDRRQFGGKAAAIGGGGALIILLLGLLFGVDPRALMQIAQQVNGPQGAREQREISPAEERLATFTKTVFRDTEIVWDAQFRKLGKRYDQPTLVLFADAVESACGTADSAVGPFYCPADSRVYIDLSFYRDMEKQLSAGGEFARAYVVAHEVGHHVQRLLGYSKIVDRARGSSDRREANRMSVRLELQADYLAGVWAHHAQEKFHFLEAGDIDSALNAAFQIGDDRLQQKSRGRVVPDSFTHGTSRQRQRWFRAGFDTGDLKKARALFELPYEQL